MKKRLLMFWVALVANILFAGAAYAASQSDSTEIDTKIETPVVDSTEWGWIKSHLALERRVAETLRAARKKYEIGEAVNLNDYLAWSDSTVDWANVYIDKETEEWLNDKGVYYDSDHYDWVLRSFPRYALLEKPIYHSVTRTGINDYRACICEWSLEGRQLKSRLVLPDCSVYSEGTVVVRIFVNSKGKVWMAWRMKGTTVKNKSLIIATVDAARQARFNEGKSQKGTITYHF